MKKFSLVFVLLVFFSLSSKAQMDLGYWGFKGGLSLPSIQDNSERELGLTTRVAYHAGIFKSFQVNNFLSIKAELMYTEKGGRKKPEEIFLLVISPYKVRTSYVSLPLIAQASIYGIYFEVGIEPARQLNVVVVNENSGIDSDAVAGLWTRDYDLNGIIGIGFYDDITGFESNIRYMPGLIKTSNEIVFTNANGDPLGTQRYGYNNVFQASVSYRIR